MKNSVIVYTTNLTCSIERAVHQVSKIYVMGQSIELTRKTPVEIYLSLKTLAKYIRRNHREWNQKNNYWVDKDYSKVQNTFLVDCMIEGKLRTNVCVDHIGVGFEDGEKFFEIHNAFRSHVTRTRGLRDSEYVWSHKLHKLFNAMTNRYYFMTKNYT